MPEHRQGTPTELRDLESFLWWDFDHPNTWREWTHKRGFVLEDLSSGYAEAIEVQRALRALEAVNTGGVLAAETVKWLNKAIDKHAITPRVTSTLGVTMNHKNDDPVGHLLTLVLKALAVGDWSRFKLCSDATCRASFFDATRNGTKKWCSMDICGSRNKMRRHRARATENRP